MSVYELGGNFNVGGGAGEKQMQILRLTTPRLKSAWGPFRSG
jgi:hypothetical protein